MRRGVNAMTTMFCLWLGGAGRPLPASTFNMSARSVARERGVRPESCLDHKVGIERVRFAHLRPECAVGGRLWLLPSFASRSGQIGQPAIFDRLIANPGLHRLAVDDARRIVLVP